MKNFSIKYLLSFALIFSCSIFLNKTIFGFYIDKTIPTACNKDIVADNSIKLPKFFSPIKRGPKTKFVVTDPIALQQAAKDTLAYFDIHGATHRKVISPKNFNKQILPTKKVIQTLKYIVSTIDQDKESGEFRILDPEFIQNNFQFIKWKGDESSAKQNLVGGVENGNIRLTHYVTYCVNGRYEKTKKYCYPLYSLKNPSQKINYTKQQILSGVINKKRINPLVWLTRDGLEEAFMQGTIFVMMPDNQMRAFNVNHNNGFKYNPKIKDKRNQKLYWFFREIKNVKTLLKRCRQRKGVVFAGDIYNIGLGKLVALSYKNNTTGKTEMQLGIIADTGGAFVRNLYQLDMFSGIFNSKNALKQYLSKVPTKTNAYILCKKPNVV